MNETVIQDFTSYLQLTDGDKAAASNLTLATALRECHAAASAPTVSGNTPLTVPEVAKHLRVRPDKVLAWIRSGRLRGYNIAERENGRPKYRVNPDDLEAFMQQRAVTQPAPKGRPVGRRRIPVIARPTL